MNKFSALISATVAALLFAAGSAHAAPQEVVKLPRVVITGKSVPAAAQVAQVMKLPRVVVAGLSVRTQLQLQTLAAAKPATRAL